jgi:cinnamoyl-CoA:phenyllactate CoA-transferase
MPPFDIFYPKFMPLIAAPRDLVGNPRYSMDSITKNKLHGEFIANLDEAMAAKTAAEWGEIFVKNDIPHSVCQVWEEVLEDPQAWAIGVFENVDYPTGKRAMVRPPVKLESVESLPYGKAPLLGQHSEEILRELGYSEEQLKDMHARGVFNTWEDVKEACGG